MIRALIVVDVQRDFCEGGSLAVTGGSDVAESIATYLRRGPDYSWVVFSRDTHNAWFNNCGHFSEAPDYVDTWPEHCVKGSDGWRFHPAMLDFIDLPYAIHVEKGQGVPAYSAFEGSVVQSTYFGVSGAFNGAVLGSALKGIGIDSVDICGLALDHCVKATAIDARRQGLDAVVLRDLTAAVDPSADTMGYLAARGVGQARAL